LKTENEVLENMMNSSAIRDIGLTKDGVKRFIKAYKDSILETLLDNGYVCLDEDIRIEIVRLTKRIHKLRGVNYEGSRNFKLKLSIGNPIHDKICEQYLPYEE